MASTDRRELIAEITRLRVDLSAAQARVVDLEELLVGDVPEMARLDQLEAELAAARVWIDRLEKVLALARFARSAAAPPPIPAPRRPADDLARMPVLRPGRR